jgi:hypothetical protein
MRGSRLSRLFALTALSAIVVWPAVVSGDSSPVPRLKFRAIQVDVRGVRESGDATSAEWIAQDLPGDLRNSFAEYMTPSDRRAATLLVRVDLVTLGDPSGNPHSTQAVDSIQGTGVVTAAGGRRMASYPFGSVVHAYPAETVANGVSDRTRISNLALSFATWLPGEMGLR